jgi:predicted small metal-binding protein
MSLEGGIIMAQKEYRQLSCRDAGADCDFLVRAETEDEVMNLAGQHACLVHNMCEVTPELKAKMHESMRVVSPGRETYAEPKMKWEIPSLG